MLAVNSKKAGENIPKRPKGFQPGHPGGPGRPKKEICVPDILRKIGEGPVPPILLAEVQATWGTTCRPANMREAWLLSQYAKAVRGDDHATDFIINRTEGKVVDKLAVENVVPAKVVFEEIRSNAMGDISEVRRTTRTITRTTEQ